MFDGVVEVVEYEEITLFKEKFKEMVEYFYKNGWITEKEYTELIDALKGIDE